MLRYRRRLWLYPLFQIPFMCLGACLVAAALFWLLGIGRPQVAVTIALDLSGSTYFNDPQLFNVPGTVSYQEVQAVNSYIQKNAEILREPNQIKVLGFGGVVIPLTSNFQADGQQIAMELAQALNDPNLVRRVAPDATDLDLAILESIDTFQGIQDRCREVLLVTDGEAPVSSNVIQDAEAKNVKVNAVVVGGDAPQLRAAALATGGIYLSGTIDNLQSLFTDRFFTSFNSNRRWVIFWLGAAWIALMWTLYLPLDRWVFQALLKLPMNQAGQFALVNAIFWTVATPAMVWRLAGGLPFTSLC